eukprot:m.118268 g.118268  ORF g.118268 m.118268 type:complete len:694 (-) comp14276_c0_seq2:1573-3654(-)
MEESLNAVPWDELIADNNLQKLLKAIVQRLDRQDQAIAGKIHSNLSKDGSGDSANFVLIDKEELNALRQRVEVVENSTLQARLQSMGQEKSLTSLAAEGQSRFKLKEHVIPLTQMKKRIEGCEIGLDAHSAAIDDTNNRLTETTKVLHETLQRELAKMVTKEEFHVLEEKHQALSDKVDRLEKDLVERLERMIKEVQDQVDVINERLDNFETKLSGIMETIDGLKENITSLDERTAVLEEVMPSKADRSELEAAIQEIRDELDKLNIEEIMAMVTKANERLDLMDERADAIEDDVKDLREYVLRKEKEMEDLQLEKQIENLRRELEEAKSGVFLKATQRMDEMEKETESLKAQVADAQGNVQVNRESIEELEEVMREAGAQISTKNKTGGTQALIMRLQDDVAALQQRYMEAAEKEAAGQEHAEKTETLVNEIKSKMSEIERAKADRGMVEAALAVKADKDAVARDTEANQRAVDLALSTMNAGTQGIQQMLEEQEGHVLSLDERLASKLDKDELAKIEQTLAEVGGAGNRHECSAEQSEALYGAYGVTAEDAAAMSRPLQRYNCLTCQRPLKPTQQPPLPALPLLPTSKTGSQQAYIPRRRSTQGVPGSDSIVEVTDIGRSLRSAGGSYTATRKSLGETTTPKRAQSATPKIREKPTELVGEDGRIYQGRLSKDSYQRDRNRRPNTTRPDQT